MPMQRYICIAESLYEDKASWLAWGICTESDNPSSAAGDTVMRYPDEMDLDVNLLGWEDAETAFILVKNIDTGEIFRVVVDFELSIAGNEAAIDKSFIPPKEQIMRFCNPDCLIEWRPAEPPRYKKDYVGKLVRVTEFDRQYLPDSAAVPPDGAVCEITRRSNDYGGGEFELTLSWHCPACHRSHKSLIPETWVSERKAFFVEPAGLADYTQALDDERPAMLYLATSYSHPDPAKRAARANLASECAAWLMHKGWSVASPLSMGHAIWTAYPNLETGFEFWREPCLRMLEMSDALVVLLLDGVRESVGVAAEIDHARKLGIPLNQVKLPGPDGGGEPFEVVPQPKWWR